MSVSDRELADARAEIARLQAQVKRLQEGGTAETLRHRERLAGLKLVIEAETLRVVARDARIGELERILAPVIRGCLSLIEALDDRCDALTNRLSSVGIPQLAGADEIDKLRVEVIAACDAALAGKEVSRG